MDGPRTDANAEIKVIVDGKEGRLTGVKLKLEPSPELLKAMQDMGTGTKELGDTIQQAGKVEVGAIYWVGYISCARDMGVLAASLVIGAVLLRWWRKP